MNVNKLIGRNFSNSLRPILLIIFFTVIRIWAFARNESAQDPTINASAVSGNMIACNGTASESVQFSVSGSGLTANILAIPPPGFEISLSSASGYSDKDTLVESGGTVISTVLYIRLVATTSEGQYRGSILLSSTGAGNVNVPLSGTVNPTPTINAVASQTVVSGNATVAVNFSGTGNTFTWVNDTPAVGLAASGTGNIASFKPINHSYEPMTATITVTSSFTSGGSAICSSIPLTFTITVAPVVPENNFKLAITSATCRGVNDGLITVTSKQLSSYAATITGNGQTASYPFTDSLMIDNLAAGSYSVCFTIAGQTDFQECDDVIVSQPQNLSVYTTVSTSDNSLILALNGGALYNIQLNGEAYTSTANTITLPLKIGNNDLVVSTDKPCQGTVEKMINTSGIISPYPVPFQNILNLNLGNINLDNVTVQIYNAQNGQLVYSNKYVDESGVLQLDLSSVNKGVYALHLVLDNSEKIFKIVKQ
jgi:hypothetical protein